MPNVVEGEGLIPSRIAFVGEAPGMEEDRQLRPFIGASGQLLRNLLRWAGIDPQFSWITNLVKVWPGRGPDGKDLPPTPQMIAEWGPKLADELREVRPEIVVGVGRYSSEWLLCRPITMAVDHGIAIGIVQCTNCGRFREKRTDDTNTQKTFFSNPKNKGVLALDRSLESRIRQSQLQRTAEQGTSRSLRIGDRSEAAQGKTRGGSPVLRSKLRESIPPQIRSASQERQKILPPQDSVQEWSREDDRSAIQEKTQEPHAENWVGMPDLQEHQQETLLGQAQTRVECCTSPAPRSLTFLAMMHPAAVLHDGSVGPRLVWDAKRVAELARTGKLPMPARFDTTVRQCDPYYAGTKLAGADTEGTPDKPWGASISEIHGEAAVVKAGGQLHTSDADLLFHYALWDIPVMRALGHDLSRNRILDTCVGAFNLQTEPGGLKELVRRWYRKEMPHYSEVVAPWLEKARTEWLGAAHRTLLSWPVNVSAPSSKTSRKGSRSTSKAAGKHGPRKSRTSSQ